MSAFIIYMTKVSLCLVGFTLFFRTLLMRETFFRLTRGILILGMALCLVIPAFHFTTRKAYVIQMPMYKLEQLSDNNRQRIPGNIVQLSPSEVTPLTTPNIFQHEDDVDWMRLLFIVYIVGVVLMLFREGISLYRLRSLLRNNYNQQMPYGKYTLIVTDKNITPFSFMKWIVVSRDDYENYPKEIITHETMHIEKSHNVDVLFSELFLMFNWFNPAAWLLRNDLREIHEYEADRGVIAQRINPRKYQLLLLEKAVGEKMFTNVVNNFNHCKIKNRIMMMLQKKSSPASRLRALFILPFFAAFLLAFTTPSVENSFAKPEFRNNDIVKDFVYFYQHLQQPDNYSIYLYLDENDHLLMMDKIGESANIRSLKINEKGLLEHNLERAMAETDLTSGKLNVIIAASESSTMQDINVMKEQTEKAFGSKYPDSEKEGKNLVLTFVEVQDNPVVNYQKFVDKYTENGEFQYAKVPIEEQKKMYEYFIQMTQEEQLKQKVQMVCDRIETIPAKKVSDNDFKSWLNAKKYAVWIDGQKIENFKLASYKIDDFSYYEVTKISRKSPDYGKYRYEVILATNEFFKLQNEMYNGQIVYGFIID